jgi:arginase
MELYLSRSYRGGASVGTFYGPDYITGTSFMDKFSSVSYFNHPGYNNKIKDVRILHNKIKNSVINRDTPALFGGDHSSTPSIIQSKDSDSIGLLWIDAHTDYNTFQTTLTGNIHGMVISAIMGDIPKLSFMECPNVQEVVVLGGRSIDFEEKKRIEKSDSVRVVKKPNEAMDYLRDYDSIHLSFDMDWIDPEYCPGVSVRERNGATPKEAESAIDTLSSLNIDSFDIVELNPLYDINMRSTKLANYIGNYIIKQTQCGHN